MNISETYYNNCMLTISDQFIRNVLLQLKDLFIKSQVGREEKDKEKK